MLVLFQLGFLAPNIDRSSAKVYWVRTTEPVPCTDTFSTSKRSCRWRQTTNATLRTSVCVGGAATETLTSTLSIDPVKLGRTLTD
jgi:hypothetical protein